MTLAHYEVYIVLDPSIDQDEAIIKAKFELMGVRDAKVVSFVGLETEETGDGDTRSSS